MRNRELEATLAYHNGTKHSAHSIRSSPHYLDWDNQPLPLKIYSTLEPIPLPNDFPFSDVPLLSAIAASGISFSDESVPDLKTLARLFYFSGGITKQVKYSGGTMHFRAAACTGALYHIELYLVCGDLPDLEAGVYHFSAHDFSLRRLRSGDYRRTLLEATGGEPAVAHAPAQVVCTSTYWRNSWKYQARAYRHCFWDSGTMLANLLAVASAQKVPARVVAGFTDAPVNHLLSLDTEREVALSIVPLGFVPGVSPPASPKAEPLTLETEPLSKREVDYPAIRAMHTASSLVSAEEAAAWRAAVSTAPPRTAQHGPLFPLRPSTGEAMVLDSVEEVILRRGSTRRFAQRFLSYEQLSTVLYQATRGIAADFLEPPGTLFNELYLVVNAVEELPSGAYVFRPDEDVLELLKEGDFREQARYLGLEQDLPGDASVNIFLLADLNPVLEQFGNRGYRAAQLEASITGGRLYLAAYAQRLGATGLTFYDDAVTAFFSPHAEGKSVMFLVAVGKSARRRQS